MKGKSAWNKSAGVEIVLGCLLLKRFNGFGKMKGFIFLAKTIKNLARLIRIPHLPNGMNQFSLGESAHDDTGLSVRAFRQKIINELVFLGTENLADRGVGIGVSAGKESSGEGRKILGGGNRGFDVGGISVSLPREKVVRPRGS
ncbi:MAG: hypothetical protein IJF34_10410 [Clostridia bacterium]|nr:hypothetical protein [Clostridia bacterium]MBQ4622913.1 hypothetical protein [Clostridia bacterium]